MTDTSTRPPPAPTAQPHVSSFTEDADGFITVECSECGPIMPVPDWETAADVWGDHRAAAVAAEVLAFGQDEEG